MPLIEGMLQELEQEAAATRRVLERVPDTQLGWRPHPKSPLPSIYGPTADENPFG